MSGVVLSSFFAVVLSVSSAQLLGGEQAIDDLTDPGVQAAANAAVQQLNSVRSSDLPELILYRIVSGTTQVVNGINYRLNIELADALTCLNDNMPSTVSECPVDLSTLRLWRAEVFESSGSPATYSIGNITLVGETNLGGGGSKMIIQNFTDPRVLGAACAAANRITEMSNSVYKQVVVSVLNGTYQVVNGLKYDLVIEVALSTTCDRNSPECFANDCPIDDRTQMLWTTSVVASPTPQPTYTILSVSLIHNGGSGGGKMIIRNFTDPRILGAACATAMWITARSNTAYKQVVVSVLNGTYQVVNGLKYDLVIELALSMICDRNSPECFVSDCPIDDRTRMLWMTSVVASPAPQPTYSVLSVSQIHSVTPPGGKMIIQNFTDPRVRGAACAAANQITEMSHSINKQVVVSILNGTQQVVNGIRYELWIEVALSITCERNSPECFSDKCPVDDRTRLLWMASVVASPTPQPTYSVLSVSQVPTIRNSGTGGAAAIVSHLLAIVAMLAISFVI
ncbi:uncharacterized protein [Dysidea avara]|uniref:uncharacterized protein n=1 Tax=Dysidea avara TaxID=196820 RepID=UPI00331D6871